MRKEGGRYAEEEENMRSGRVKQSEVMWSELKEECKELRITC